MEHYLIPNLAERTSDQLIINMASFPELGISGAAISGWIKGMGAEA